MSENDSLPKLAEPVHYLKKFLESTIQVPRDFVFLRQQITKSSHLEETKPVECEFKLEDKSLHAKTESGEKVFPFSSFDKIDLKKLDGTSGSLKYISITVKGDRNPIILHGPLEITELWYDALNLYAKKDITFTNSSQSKIDMLKKAVDYGNVQLRENIEVPPPPPNFDFVSNF